MANKEINTVTNTFENSQTLWCNTVKHDLKMKKNQNKTEWPSPGGMAEKAISLFFPKAINGHKFMNKFWHDPGFPESCFKFITLIM